MPFKYVVFTVEYHYQNAEPQQLLGAANLVSLSPSKPWCWSARRIANAPQATAAGLKQPQRYLQRVPAGYSIIIMGFFFPVIPAGGKSGDKIGITSHHHQLSEIRLPFYVRRLVRLQASTWS